MKNIAVVYWTGTGNTEKMANSVVEGAKVNGDNVELIFSDDFTADKFDEYDVVAFGCPAMGDEVLEEDSFEPMFESVEGKFKDRKIAIFGSYEWNEGQWMDDWKERCDNAGAVLVYEALKAYDDPSDEDLEKCVELGKACANA